MFATGSAIGGSSIERMAVLVERNGSHAAMAGRCFVHVPGIRGGISGDMGRELLEGQDRLLIEGTERGDIGGIKGLGEFSQHHIPVLGSGGGRHPGALAPEIFFLLLRGAIGLLLVGGRAYAF